MRKCFAVMAGIVTVLALVATAFADESSDSARATAIAACREHTRAKRVTIAIEIDGTTTKHRYNCSEILATNPDAGTPATSDFRVGIHVLRKQCFGTAGCTIAYKPKVRYTGTTPLDPSKTYTVVYDVAGAESPITANLAIRGKKVDTHNEVAYTPSKDAELTATVTSVLEGT
jgi:hypothetical protein